MLPEVKSAEQMMRQDLSWKMGSILVLSVLTGCFEQLPEPNSCETNADCQLGQSCAANRCIIVDERDQAADMLARPDLDAPDLLSNQRVITILINDGDVGAGVPVNYSGIAICLAGGDQKIFSATALPGSTIKFTVDINTSYDIYAAKTTNGEPYYAESMALDLSGGSISDVHEILLKSCDKSSCGEVSPCYQSAFNPPYFGP